MPKLTDDGLDPTDDMSQSINAKDRALILAEMERTRLKRMLELPEIPFLTGPGLMVRLMISPSALFSFPTIQPINLPKKVATGSPGDDPDKASSTCCAGDEGEGPTKKIVHKGNINGFEDLPPPRGPVKWIQPAKEIAQAGNIRFFRGVAVPRDVPAPAPIKHLVLRLAH